MPLRLYNTLTRRTEPFVPADPAHITFYTCGPTVYDDAHIGNFRSFLAADVLRRWLESPLCELEDGKGGVSQGPRRVTHVMNITDVGHMTDDAEGGEAGEDRMAVAGKRLAEAKKSGKLPPDAKIDPNDPYSIAAFYADRFLEDARKLGLKVALEAQKDATLMPRATANVPGMIAVIARLMEKGHAYVAGPAGSRAVYFRVKSFPNYGRLSGNTLDQLREGEGGRISSVNQSQKEHPADFLLWKEDASHVMKWDSPWGAGYPGWHIECTVMSVGRLTPSRAGPNVAGLMSSLSLPDGKPLIDLHSGGEDNIFPHHECEIAQSCCAFNAAPEQGSFAKMWFHPRFLLVEGTKMSKSKGNFFTARDLFAKGIEPAALRLEIIKTHYRSNANFTMQGLVDSQRRVERWRWFACELMAQAREAIPGFTTQVTGFAPKPSTAYLDELESSFTDALNEDLNIAGALAALDSLYSEATERLKARIQQVADGAPILRVSDEDLPVSPLPVADALAMMQAGQKNKTFEWELGLLHVLDNVLGVIFTPGKATSRSDIGVFIGIGPDAGVMSKLEERRAARAAKDFKKSDAIRDELLKMGFQIKDVAGGRVEVRRA